MIVCRVGAALIPRSPTPCHHQLRELRSARLRVLPGVGSSNPANYIWNLSTARKWGGGISAYTGVNNTTPLDSTVATAVTAASL